MEVQEQEHLEGVQSTLRVDTAGEFFFFLFAWCHYFSRDDRETRKIAYVQDDTSSENQDENVIFRVNWPVDPIRRISFKEHDREIKKRMKQKRIEDI